MTEQELRAVVREAIARHAGARPGSATAVAPQPIITSRQDASHAMFVLPAGDGPCLIEPTVTCNHCGYCKSYGH
jgi:hypothetical protein